MPRYFWVVLAEPRVTSIPLFLLFPLYVKSNLPPLDLNTPNMNTENAKVNKQGYLGTQTHTQTQYFLVQVSSGGNGVIYELREIVLFFGFSWEK